jgi:hypothetical protein
MMIVHRLQQSLVRCEQTPLKVVFVFVVSVSPLVYLSRFSLLASRLLPLASRLLPLASLLCLSPLTSRLSPLTSRLSPLTSRLSPLASPRQQDARQCLMNVSATCFVGRGGAAVRKGFGNPPLPLVNQLCACSEACQGCRRNPCWGHVGECAQGVAGRRD